MKTSRLTDSTVVFHPTDLQVAAAECVFACIAYEQLMRVTVEAYKRRILLQGQWKPASHFRLSDADSEVVLEPREAWVLSEEDFAVYIERCEAARVAAKLKVSGPGLCPLLEAEGLTRDANREMLIAMEGVLPISPAQIETLTMHEFNRLVDLTLRLLAPHCRAERALARFTDDVPA